MIRLSQIKLPAGHTREDLEKKIKKQLRNKKGAVLSYTIIKKSIDARKKPQIFYQYTVDVWEDGEKKESKKTYQFPPLGTQKMKNRPLIVGMGPAGLFCAYLLAEHGYAPILFERGKSVEDRVTAVEDFWSGKALSPECNVQFGEGGAGTFSDGKLNTLVKDKLGRNHEVLSILVKEGAPEEILYEGKPHIGTDILAKVVKNMRHKILANGGEIQFSTKVTDLLIENDRIRGIIAGGKQFESENVVLALGHSARDTFYMLWDKKIPMEAKAFAVGLRVEHRQRMINEAQYGRQEIKLPPANYKLTARAQDNRGVYTFCMCPGGYVVDASSEEGFLAVNGMSYSGRGGANANSAVIVTVTPEDFENSHPLAGIEFQRDLEKKAWEIGEGKIPVQRFGEFRAKVLCADQEEIESDFMPCIKGGWKFADVSGILPKEINQALVQGMEAFDRMIPGFAGKETLLSGVESRTSSPVRMPRDESGQSVIKGIYPCGEGAGYAGGITSAAMDGIKTAEYIAMKYSKYQEGR